MKIQGGSGPGAATPPSRPQAQAPAGFEPAATAVRDAAPAGPAGSLGAVPSLDGLLALQETLGPTERRRRAVKRAGRLLDILDAVKLSLLDGMATSGSSTLLKSIIDERRQDTEDPLLEGVLDEIETRAAVEMAKQEMAHAARTQAA
jgi:hypothetical protein